MEIIHRISINSLKDNEFFTILKEIGIQYKSLELPGKKSNLIIFDISESNPNWEKVSKLITNYGASNVIETFFSPEEIKNAEWIRIMAYEHGYPQPENSWPFNNSSYKIICPQCAIHEQVGNMRIKKEPNLGKKDFMSLVWTNEIFVTDKILTGLVSIGAKGYEVRDVIINKTEIPSQVVHQIFIPEVALEALLKTDEMKSTVCQVCGNKKYNAHMKGIMYVDKNSILPDTDFLLTNEWFGNGLIAYREILISNRIASLILDKGWQGVRMKAIELI